MNPQTYRRWQLILLVALSALVLFAAVLVLDRRTSSTGAALAPGKTSACSLALAQHSGSAALDQQIADHQRRLAKTPNSPHGFEQLGWLFVRKARESFDPGYYKLAEQCAACIDSSKPNSQEALLLRAHVLHSLHTFAEAETLARKLVNTRGRAFDFGVLGDILVDTGKVDEAAEAYQRMMDQRPDLQSYIRAAHLNWLLGRGPKALQLMKLATDAASPADAESAAWAYSRQSLYQFQYGDVRAALASAEEALGFVKDYAPALFVRGRILLSQGQSEKALNDLKQAATLSKLPEYQWYLADALHAVGRVDEASDIERELLLAGAVNDPRTFALFLSTRDQQIDRALALARDELKVRQDIFSHDALAWALAASGNLAEARVESNKAMKHKTEDARLLFHAGVIALKSGDASTAKTQLMRAKAISHMLTAREQELLSRYLQTL